MWVVLLVPFDESVDLFVGDVIEADCLRLMSSAWMSGGSAVSFVFVYRDAVLADPVVDGGSGGAVRVVCLELVNIHPLVGILCRCGRGLYWFLGHMLSNFIWYTRLH